MQRLTTFRPVLAAVIALGALAGASAAGARTVEANVDGLHLVPPALRAQPQAVQAQPARVGSWPVVAAPAPVRPVPVAARPAPLPVQPQWGNEGAWHGGMRERVPVRVERGAEFHRGHADARGPWGDADHDGVPNRYDRAPMNPYRH